MLMDYHLHTRFSFDGEQSLEALCTRAQALGVTHMAVTDHVDGPTHYGLLDIQDPTAYRQAVDAARKAYPALTIHRGLELGYQVDYWDETLRRIEETEADYLLGSLHLVEGLDPYEPAYFAGRSRREAYAAYLDALEDALDYLLPRVQTVAHLDYVSKFSPHPPLRYEDFPRQLDRILQCIIDSPAALELNTSGYRRAPQGLPGDDILIRYRELGGRRVVLGSDAHRESDVATHYGKALASLRRAGFSAVCLYGPQGWQEVSLDALTLPPEEICFPGKL